MKVIPFYLPQFHATPENDAWWGEGFTEWVNVKAAKPLFEGHNQPRVPLAGNYYDLTDAETLRWQSKLVKKYGIYGLCFYHYWFDGHLLLHKPMELLLANKDIDLRYCISWANEDWTNAWVSTNNTTLISQTYGGEDQWIEHYRYLEPFFLDERYIREDGKPLVVIYRPELIPDYRGMIECWQKLAMESGLRGLCICVQHINYCLSHEVETDLFDLQIEYQPQYARYFLKKNSVGWLREKKRLVDVWLQKHFHRTLDMSVLRGEHGPVKESYDDIWQEINTQKPWSSISVPCAMVDWDNTPRRGRRGWVAVGASPEKFKSYFSDMLHRTREIYEKDYIFVFAWNEWAEGGYLEPDETNGFAYLEAIRDSLEEAGMLPVSGL